LQEDEGVSHVLYLEGLSNTYKEGDEALSFDPFSKCGKSDCSSCGERDNLISGQIQRADFCPLLVIEAFRGKM
jgi:hypothetical protein